MFSTFPAGWPGAGLLLLRSVIGVTLVAQGIGDLVDWNSFGLVTRAVAVLSLVSGTSLLIGYLTPLASLVAALMGVGLALSWFQSPSPNLFDIRPAAGFAIAIAVAVICLGPGAFSVDARLFGRREIIIPEGSRPLEP
jgi:uncharacterized membrane protein YphA (DoxX/SURF4 family)